MPVHERLLTNPGATINAKHTLQDGTLDTWKLKRISTGCSSCDGGAYIEFNEGSVGDRCRRVVCGGEVPDDRRGGGAILSKKCGVRSRMFSPDICSWIGALALVTVRSESGLRI